MKYMKSSIWWRLRGQIGPNGEICKIDTLIKDRERCFFIPETEEEKAFFDVDKLLGITLIPYGAATEDAENGPWGYRFYADKTEEDAKRFSKSISTTVKRMYEDGTNAIMKSNKDRILN